MSPIELIAILALVGYSIYRQTQVAPVTGPGRFKMAIIYGIVGLAVGGFAAPHGVAAVVVLSISALLSVVVGLARGRLTRMWMGEDGVIYRQGTVLTVALFIGLVVVKFGLGALAYVDHINEGGGFGEIMVMIAIMIGVQAELVWQRAQVMQARTRQVAFPA